MIAKSRIPSYAGPFHNSVELVFNITVRLVVQPIFRMEPRGLKMEEEMSHRTDARALFHQASAADCAAYVLARHGPMTAMRLHKILYYSQARCLIYEKRPLFLEPIVAWREGPMVPAVWQLHRKQYRLESLPERTNPVQAEERNILDHVAHNLAGKTPSQLSRMTHSGRPWREARKRGDKVEITRDSIREYFARKEFERLFQSKMEELAAAGHPPGDREFWKEFEDGSDAERSLREKFGLEPQVAKGLAIMVLDKFIFPSGGK